MAINSLNKTLEVTDVDGMIEELCEREEFSCTRNFCTGDSCNIVFWDDLINKL